jgi:hypothetical protein
VKSLKQEKDDGSSHQFKNEEYFLELTVDDAADYTAKEYTD